MSRARTPVRIVAFLATLLGVLFTLQGLGIVGGSFMTGQRLWLVIGIVLVVVGIVVLAGGLRGPGSAGRDHRGDEPRP